MWKQDADRATFMCKGPVGRRGELTLRHGSVFARQIVGGHCVEGRQPRVNSGGLWILHMCFEFILHIVKKHGREADHCSTNGCAPVLVPV